jgi:septum formation protein
LLDQIGLKPDMLLPVEIDETWKKEKGRPFSVRLAREKAEAGYAIASRDPEKTGSYIIAADTVVYAVGRVLPKTELVDEAAQCLRLLSGRAHRVYTAVCLATPKGSFRERLVETRVRFKRLSEQDIEAYLASGEWQGKAGGYAIQGLAGSFVIKLIGSYSAVVGLPLYETAALLGGEGFPIQASWYNIA